MRPQFPDMAKFIGAPGKSVERIESTPFLLIIRKHSLDAPTGGMLFSLEVEFLGCLEE